ncbi:FKBP-type peptidyl-prolyl cis-trans isomerase [Tenacibaculum sp. M341]|uniref:FKBP-type peptidyl-prolyl cis-trans isomerase n=1 Tax=Tenacibaculum sp. M341 TaxID=2530339 RepID=UPI00104FF446|nr:FKBP-type peptidyl-prolyl cis-trans isomerase [Tenacibaculum sp. M341]TCI84840.1 peptidylprolyl isomerase [Tenacibaculum sp. M341]
MIKFKNILLLALLSVMVYSCGDNGVNPLVDNFDHAGQAVIDNDSIVNFLKLHYYEETSESIEPWVTGKTTLYDDPNLKIQDIKETINDVEIDYKLYTYISAVGGSPKGNPSVVDSVLVDYSGRKVLNSKELSAVTFDSNVNTWFVLGKGSVIDGWTYGIPNLIGGVLPESPDPNEPISFTNSGKAFLFMPSGLAYRNIGNGAVFANEILMFSVELKDVILGTDLDADGVASIDEDLDGDGLPWNDDTDGDNLANYLDIDDDGDTVPTLFEDADKDGNPANDFNDPNKPDVPDYLNIDVRNSNQDD